MHAADGITHDVPAMRLGRVLLGLLVGAFLGGRETRAASIHAPLAPNPGEEVTISASFFHPEGIRRIDLRVVSGTIVGCSQVRGVDSVTPCRKGALTETHTCQFGLEPGHEAEAECVYRHTFGAGTLVTYQATATTGTGTSLRDDEISFSQEDSSTSKLLRPIIWRSARAPLATIDIGFFPSGDYGNGYTAFLVDVEKLVSKVFFGTASFAAAYSESRGLFNIWAGPFGAEVSVCDRTFDAATSAMKTRLTGSVILHQNPFDGEATDCATLSLGSGSAEASVFTESDGSPEIFVHESGHFLHGLGDEYPCRGGYGTVDDCRNLFKSDQECDEYRGHRIHDGRCVPLACPSAAPDVWRIANDQTEIMEVFFSADAAWRLASRQCVQARFDKCRAGMCYP